jgi:CheY-like chemotaxis protein
VSKLGQGSTFTVYLPLDAEVGAYPDAAELIASLAAPAVNGKPPVPDTLYEGSSAGATVLVVDDDARNIFALTALLERGKLEVVTAESGADALLLLEQRPDIDLVLMDIMMPSMNGYEAMAEIRKQPHLAALPIIAVTGKVVGGERARCLAAGASDYIAKPVDTSELFGALGKWFPSGPRARR